MNDATEDSATRPGFWQCLKNSAGMTERDRRNHARFVRWGLAWIAALSLATFFLAHQSIPGTATGWIVASIPAVCMAGMMYRFIEFLRNADELVRNIQLESMAVGFAAAFAVGIGYAVFERAGAPRLEIIDIFQVLVLGYTVGTVVASWRYR